MNEGLLTDRKPVIYMIEMETEDKLVSRGEDG